MVQPHPYIQTPPNETIIWRYMNYTKFLSCLLQSSLHFSRFDKLGDPFEGSSHFEQERFIKSQEGEVKRAGNYKNFEKAYVNVKYSMFINCWHMTETESDLMWKAYCPSGDGVAIKSTVKDMVESFRGEKNQVIYIGKVNYIDYEREEIPPGNVFHNFLHKRKYFKSENELRAIAWTYQNEEIKKIYNPLEMKLDKDDPKYFGFYFSVNFQRLLNAVYLSPFSQKWLVDLTRHQLKIAGLDKVPVFSSGLDSRP